MEKALLLYKIINNEGVPFPSADNQLKLSGFTYRSARMGGAPTITGNVRSVDSLEGQWDNVYADFNGERFYVRTEPDNSKDNSSIGETYSVTLYSQRYVLDNVYMIDAVQSDISVDGYQSNSTKVQFMGDIVEWAARLNASFSYTGLASDGWSVVIDSGISSEDKMVSFEDMFVSEALQEGFAAYNIPYYFVGKVIHFGYTANAVTTPFEYGADNSLLSVQKNNANYKIVNRCSGYGSSDNLPYYYPNASPKGSVIAEAADTNAILRTEHIVIFNAERFANKVSTTDTISYSKPALIFKSKKVQQFDSNTERYSYRELTSDSTISELRNISAYRAYIPIKVVVTTDAASTYKILSPVRLDGELKILSALLDVRADGVDVTNSVSLDPSDSSFEVFLSAGDHTIYYTVVASIYYDEAYLSRVITIAWASDGLASWHRGTTKVTDLSSIGVRVSVTPANGDSFHQAIKPGSYIAPVDALMPPIFRASGGVDRFYNALNGTYEKPDGSGYYTFNHPYESGDRREQTVSFDNVKPTIKGMANSSGQSMDRFLDFAWDTNDNDEIDPDTGEYVHPYFFAKLPKYDGENGFNLFDCSSESGEMTIAMTSGTCGSCNFEIHVGEETQKNTVQVDSDGNLLRNDKGEVRCGSETLGQPKETPQDRQNDTKSYEVWIALAKDVATYPVVMPSHQRGLVPMTSDTFVILNIALPQAYITAAEKKLEQEIIAYMALNNDEKFSFSISFSRIFFEENPAVLAQLNENARIIVRHHNIDRAFYISNFTYAMKEGDILPEITVDLVDELTSSSNSLQQRIDAVKQDLLDTLGGGDTLKSGMKYFLRKNAEDYAQKKIHFLEGAEYGSFERGSLGSGGSINSSGAAELDSLSLRKFLEVPELRYNRISINVGNSWRAPGGGVIEKVVPDYDADGNLLNTGIVYLHLEDGEPGRIALDDICMGIYHDGIDLSNNSTVDTDDSIGNFRFTGFFTAYFRVTEVLASDNSCFRYSIRPTSTEWPETMHPVEAMHFVVYGNFSDTDRQSSRYSTRTYERYLKGVASWEFTSEDNIAAQFGDLSNLSAFGLQMSGYSAYLNNIYMSGTIKQFLAYPLRIEIDNNGMDAMAYGETMDIKCTVYKGWDDMTDKVVTWKIVRDTGNPTEDAAWALTDKAKNFAGSITIEHTESYSDLGTIGVSTLFTITATLADSQTANFSLTI